MDGEEYESGDESGEQVTYMYCSVPISIYITKYDTLIGGDIALYKFPPTRASEQDGVYQVKVTEHKAGVVVATKTIHSNSSGWQIAQVNNRFVKSLPTGGDVPLTFNIHVEHDGRSLSCPEIKSLLALDCSVPRPSTNYPYTENLLPSLVVYVQSNLSIFEILMKLHRIPREVEEEAEKEEEVEVEEEEEEEEEETMARGNCRLVTAPVLLQDIVQIDGYKILFPKTADIGVCVPELATRHLGAKKNGDTKPQRTRTRLRGRRGKGRGRREGCSPTKYRDLHVLIENTRNSQVTTEVLQQLVATECN